jgi:hypothetical protein
MPSETASSSSTGASLIVSSNPKCHHVTASGRQCRLRAIRSGLCFRHAALQLQPAQPVEVDLSADFLVKFDDLQSAEQIHQFLAKLLILVVENRISARRAAVMTYIINQLLRSLVAMEREIASQPQQWDWSGFPRPDHNAQDSGAIADQARGCKMGEQAETQPPSPVSKVIGLDTGFKGQQANAEPGLR